MSLSQRTLDIFAFLIGCFLLIAAFYIEYVDGLQPCLLCLTQRFFLVLIIMTYLISAIHDCKTIWRKIYYGLIIIFSLGGLAAAGRQVYLQHKPPQNGDICIPGVSQALNHLSFTKKLLVMVKGSDDCGQVLWTLFSLSMAEWTMVLFLFFIIIGLFQFYKKP